MIGAVTRVRVAIAQGVGGQSPDGPSIRAHGAAIRRLMSKAAADGARLILFTEGALSSYPQKQLMSSDPTRLAESDWSRADWAVLAAELTATVEHAGTIGIWTVVGSIHREPGHGRPFNSLYVIDDTGRLVHRYDKRHLSTTETTFMYAPGDHPTVFEVDGLSFGCAVCIEAGLPEVFIEYESLGVDCVLLASYSTGSPADSLDDRRPLAQALLTQMWVAFAVPGLEPGAIVSGLASPADRWLAQGCPDGHAQCVLVDLDTDEAGIRAGRDGGRPWRARQRGTSAGWPR